MLVTLENKSGDSAIIQIIEPAADEREFLRGKILNGRCEIQFAGEPRLDGVLIC